MRIIASTSVILLMITLLTVQGGLTSCTKDHTIIDTVTVIKKGYCYSNTKGYYYNKGYNVDSRDFQCQPMEIPGV